MPPGRPSSYKPEYCQQLIDHMRKGLSFESFAGLIGKGRASLYNWLKEFPEFKTAKQEGQALSLLWWERIGNAALFGSDLVVNDTKISLKNFNATVWIFNMKNRFGWRDKQDITADNNVTTNSVVILRPNETVITTDSVEKEKDE